MASDCRFDVNILGASGQNAANARSAVAGGRQRVLDIAACRWERFDPETYPFTRAMAGQLRAHDDRAEYLAGIELILDGMTTTTSGGGQ